jgi:hypothetical protein
VRSSPRRLPLIVTLALSLACLLVLWLEPAAPADSLQNYLAFQCYMNATNGSAAVVIPSEKDEPHLVGAHVISALAEDDVVDTLAHYSCDPYGNRTIRAAVYFSNMHHGRGGLSRVSNVVTVIRSSNAAVHHTVRFAITQPYTCLPGKRERAAVFRVASHPNYTNQPRRVRTDEFTVAGRLC